MSIFKNILFLPGYPSDAHAADDPGRSYAQGYGNHVASARAFAPLGHSPAPAHAAAPTAPHADTWAGDRCPARACG